MNRRQSKNIARRALLKNQRRVIARVVQDLKKPRGIKGTFQGPIPPDPNRRYLFVDHKGAMQMLFPNGETLVVRDAPEDALIDLHVLGNAVLRTKDDV
jgi:hypothetical protein